MGLDALFAVLKARKFLIAQSVVVAALIALAAGLFVPKDYLATAKVQVDSLQENLLTGLFEPRVRVSEFLGQQAAIAGSRMVALQVYDTLVTEGSFIQSDFEDQWRDETKGELAPGNDARLWAADQLLKKLEIRADALESTLAISFRSDNAAQSSRIANAFASAYMQTVLDQRQRRAARNAANFSDETRSLEDSIEKAQSDLTDFREISGIVGLGAQRLEDIEVELATLTMRLADARVDLSEAETLLHQARDVNGNDILTLPLPQDAQSGRQAQARLGAVLVQLQRLSERYGPQYPVYVETVNEKRALERTIMEAVEDRAEYANRLVASLQAALKQKKAAVVALQETKQTYDVLSKKVDASRITYDLVAARSLQESLQSRVDVVEAYLLARAVPANKPVTPPLPIIILIGIAVGLFMGAAAAVAVEFVEGRIRTKSSLGQILRAPVLAELTLPEAPRRRQAI